MSKEDISSKKNRRIQIIVALIGLAGVLCAALIANWDKIFQKQDTFIIEPSNETTQKTPSLLDQFNNQLRDNQLTRQSDSFTFLGKQFEANFNLSESAEVYKDVNAPDIGTDTVRDYVTFGAIRTFVQQKVLAYGQSDIPYYARMIGAKYKITIRARRPYLDNHGNVCRICEIWNTIPQGIMNKELIESSFGISNVDPKRFSGWREEITGILDSTGKWDLTSQRRLLDLYETNN